MGPFEDMHLLCASVSPSHYRSPFSLSVSSPPALPTRFQGWCPTQLRVLEPRAGKYAMGPWSLSAHPPAPHPSGSLSPLQLQPPTQPWELKSQRPQRKSEGLHKSRGYCLPARPAEAQVTAWTVSGACGGRGWGWGSLVLWN